jgi:hypothetical protein
MASITISSPGGAQTNPTDTQLPYNSGGVFADSILVQSNPNVLYSILSGGLVGGFYIDNTIGNYFFGDVDGSFAGNAIQMNQDGDIISNSSILILNVDNEIKLNGLITSASAGGSAGLHLKLTINGIKYKIQLLDD